MRRISTFKTLVYSSAFALLALTSNSSFAQVQNPPACGLIIEDFEDNASGFEGDMTYSPSGYLESVVPRNSGVTTTLSVMSPVYGNSNPDGKVVVGFDIRGYVRASSYVIKVYSSTDQLLYTSQSFLLNDKNENSNKQADYACVTFSDPIFKFGVGYRYEIILTIPDPKGNGGNNAVVTFDNFSNGPLEPIILPVNFKGITARMAASKVNVQWNVAQEIDVKEYVVERSTDGKGFTKVGSVSATGSDVYSFADAAPINGVSFYRVRSVDIDGKVKFSTVVRINNSQSVTLRAYPSPANNQVAIEHEALAARGKITIATADGKAVVAVNAIEGTSQTVIDLSKLNSGIYLVRLEKGNGQVESLKFVKL